MRSEWKGQSVMRLDGNTRVEADISLWRQQFMLVWHNVNYSNGNIILQAAVGSFSGAVLWFASVVSKEILWCYFVFSL